MDCPASYARIVARGYDSYQEAWNWAIGIEVETALEKAQERARSAGEPVEVDINGVVGMASPGGAKGGKRYVFKTDDLLFMFGSPKADWQISVRYLSAGLWEHGLTALREWAGDMLWQLGCRPKLDFNEHSDPAKWCRVSRADYAFDFYSPAFSAEIGPDMQRNIVAYSGVKVRADGKQPVETEIPWEMIGSSARTETLTIGSKRSLQVQVYDKTTEIREASGKEWMRDMWAAMLDGEVPERDVWRLEIRFGKEFLKNRNLRTRAEVDAAMPQMILEGVLARRVTVPDAADKNKWRWPVHPLWSEAARLSGAHDFLPVGRMVTMRRSEYIDMMTAQAAGVLRVLSVAEHGDLVFDKVPEILNSASDRLKGDGSNKRKVPTIKGRLNSLYDEAQ